MTTGTEPIYIERASTLRRAADFAELTKPRIILMVLVVAAAAFYLASGGRMNYLHLAHALIGLALANGGALALNQVAEEDIDGIMERTSARPLPAKRVGHQNALIFGVALMSLGVVYLILMVNSLTALLTAFAGVLYLLIYTPMKRISSWNTVVGAIPGALPPVIGWAAAAGEISVAAWILFSILFIWQIPHALAIGILYREDFEAAQIRILPVEEPDGRKTGLHAVNFCAALLPVGMMPTLIGMAGPAYFLVSLILGTIYLLFGIHLAKERSVPAARRLFVVSLIYVPLVLLAMVIDRSGT
ncbi:MAG: heme o synthase [bacterium]